MPAPGTTGLRKFRLPHPGDQEAARRLLLMPCAETAYVMKLIRPAGHQTTRVANPTPSCCIPDRLVQECSERTGIFPESALVAMNHDIDAFAVFQNKVQFIAIP